MKELLSRIKEWKAAGKPFAIARVIQTWGSSPRPAGSAMIISADLEMAGSVSGGCVEGAVLKEAGKAMVHHQGKLLSYGVTDDEAWTVGLTCGGRVQVYLQTFPQEKSSGAEVWDTLLECLRKNEGCVLVTELREGEAKDTLVLQGRVIGPAIPDSLKAKADEALVHRVHGSAAVGDVRYFIQVFPRRSQLLVIGAAHLSADLIQLASLYDFETIVIDPRGAFANQTQFTTAPDRIYVKYPSEVLGNFTLDAYTYAVILSHDPKIDDNALEILLRSPVAYIGALGSRKTHEKRMDRLRQKGFSDEEISRIESPIGVDIHAQGAREIALSIMGSLIRTKNAYL
jgi:xanthine dehydrogenase accessory factor